MYINLTVEMSSLFLVIWLVDLGPPTYCSLHSAHDPALYCTVLYGTLQGTLLHGTVQGTALVVTGHCTAQHRTVHSTVYRALPDLFLCTALRSTALYRSALPVTGHCTAQNCTLQGAASPVTGHSPAHSHFLLGHQVDVEGEKRQYQLVHRLLNAQL